MFLWPNPVEAAGGTDEANDLEPAAPAKLLKVPVLETKELFGALGKALVCPWFAAKNWLLLLGPERVLNGSAGCDCGTDCVNGLLVEVEAKLLVFKPENPMFC